MARKLTAKQRKAHKKASYYKSQYRKNVDAIKYLQRFGAPQVEIKEPQKITKKSVQAIRKLYEQTKRQVKTFYGDYLDMQTGELIQKLPTKEVAVKEYRQEQQGISPYQPYEPFNPDLQYIQELKDKVNALNPLRDSDKTEKNYQKNVVPKQQQVKANFMQAIDDAISKYGAQQVAKTLAQNDFMQRIGNLEEKYTYEIIDDMTDGDDGLMVLMDASVDEALLDI